MPTELKVPSFGESVTEAYMGEWLKSEGELVEEDEPLVVIETDKVTAELPAPISGRITRVLKAAGESAQIGEVIGYMEPAEAGARSDAAERSGEDAPGDEAPSIAGTPDEAKVDTGKPEPPKPDAPAPSPSTALADGGGAEPGGHLMPAARRILDASGVDPSGVRGTGPGGRILKEDALRAAHPAERQREGAGNGARETEIVPMSRLRSRIAERLVESQRTAALLTTFNEIDMSQVKALRAEHKDAFIARHGIKLGFMSFFVKAAVDALKLVPGVNARIDGSNIIYHNYADIGVAVGGGRGLVVPVLRNAERMSFAELEIAIHDFAERARANTLELEELQGGTFTISNGGVYGSLLSTPIVNPPQSGILGLHAIQDRPVARDGEVVIRPIMNVALTYDHRLIDGREAVTFLERIKDCVEEPSRMLLEI